MISAKMFKLLGGKDDRAVSAAAPADANALGAMPDPSPGVAASSSPAPMESDGAPAGSSAASDKVSVSQVETSRPPARLIDGQLVGSRMKAGLTGAAALAERWGKPAAAATVALGIGALGYAGGITAGRQADRGDLSALRWSETAASLKDTREETARIASDLKFMRVSLDALKNERARGDVAGKQAQLSDRVERLGTDLTGKVGKLTEQLERIEKTQRDPARVTAVMERLDKIEKGIQTASAPTPPPKPVAAAPAVAPAEVATTGSITEVRPPAKTAEADHRKVQVDGFVLRDIEDGLALIEARNGRFFEVSPGMTLPGLGKVEAIERRGRQWVVVTPKGYIAER